MKDINTIKKDISRYEASISALEKIKECSDVGVFACKYIDRNINAIKKHIFMLQTQIDMLEKD